MEEGSQDNDTELVRMGYDRAAASYAAGRDLFHNQRYLDRFAELLPPPATVVDVGCGSGNPISGFLVAHGYDVIGVDLSPKQIELARQLVPKGRFEVRNMLELNPGEYNVDGLVSFYAIFHTQRDRHADLLKTLASFLRPGGILLITMGASEWEGREEFHGVDMFWSHFDATKNREILERAGFDVVLDEIDASANEQHQVMLATRR